MKKLLLLVMVLLSALTLMNCSEDEDSFTPIDSDIIGTWTSPGEVTALSATIEFKTSGKFTNVMGDNIATYTGTFTVDESSVDLTTTKIDGNSIPKETQALFSEAHTFEIKDDTLFLTNKDENGLNRTLVKK